MTGTLQPTRPPSNIRRVFATVTVARIVEQALLGVAMLLLAARLGVRDFAPVSVLFIVHSVAVTLSDFGLGFAVLRLPPGTAVRRNALTSLRRVNVTAAVVAMAIGAFVGGEAGTIVAISGLLWAVTAEGFVRKTAVTRDGFVGEAAAAEMVSTLLFFAVVLVWARGDHAVAVTGAALLAKHVVEVLWVRSWHRSFAPDGIAPRPGWIWTTKAITFAINNVDFVLVRVLCGVEAFAIYSLAFRVTNAPHVQLNAAVLRTSLIDLSTSVSLQRSYDRFVRPLFLSGVAGALALGVGAFFAPTVLGSSWKPAVVVIVVLAVGLPWRMVISLATTLAMRADVVKDLARWELTRLIATVVVLTAAGLAGFPAFVAAAAAVSAVSAVLMHRASGRAADVIAWRPLIPLTLVTVALAAAIATQISAVR